MRETNSKMSMLLLFGAALLIAGIILLVGAFALGSAVSGLGTGWMKIIAMIVMCAGVAALYVVAKQFNTNKQLLNRGDYVIAHITKTFKSDKKSFNGQPVWFVECEFADPDTGVLHRFISKEQLQDPDLYITSEDIRVYIDHNDMNKYYVDVPSACGAVAVH